jgi:hypothetical protein
VSFFKNLVEMHRADKTWCVSATLVKAEMMRHSDALEQSAGQNIGLRLSNYSALQVLPEFFCDNLIFIRYEGNLL